VLVSVLLLVGWWTLGPADYKQLADHARYAVGLASNVRFWEEAGYFDVASHEKWLLHTWSLSVEWQFYLLLPIAVFSVWWLLPYRWALLVTVVVALVGSFLLSMIMTPRTPSAAFFLLPTRAWELLAGVLVYLVSDRVHLSMRVRRSLEVIGLTLIALALVVFDQQTAWPGSAALVPVMGTALVLLAMRHTPGWATPKAVQWVGLSSYSLYLWHWPAFVALVYLDLQGEALAIGVAIAAALVLAAISYHGVEQPSRRWLTRAGPVFAPAVLVAGVLVVVAVGLWVKAEDGLEGRMSAQFEAIVAEADNTNPYREQCHGRPGHDEFPWCAFGGEEIRAVLIGDSHASMLLTALRDALPEGTGMRAASYTSCPTLFGVKQPRADLECAAFNDFVFERIAADVPNGVPVIVANRLSAYAFGSHRPEDSSYLTPLVYFGDSPVDEATPEFLEVFEQRIVESACRLAEDRPVFWLRPIPEMPVDVPRWMARQTLLRGSLAEVSIARATYEERHAFVTRALEKASEHCDVTILDPVPYLCDDDRCYGTQDGMPLYYDVHHLSERGNRLLLPLFRELFNPPAAGPQ